MADEQKRPERRLHRYTIVRRRSRMPTTTERKTGSLLRALQVFSGLAVLTVLSQFITAGRLVSTGGLLEAHQAGAIVLHLVSGLAAVFAVLLWRRARTSARLPALAAVVLVLGFVQAAVGSYGPLYVHVPGAMLLTAGTVWLLLAALRHRPV
jgi:hypothetical protein